MPSRLLRDGILDSERVCSLSWLAELFYRRLMSVVDDFGRFDGRPSMLKSRAYPLQTDRVREADISRWLAECEKAGLIALYEANGKPYVVLFRLGKPRAEASKFPAPPLSVKDAVRESSGAQAPADENRCAQAPSYSDSGSRSNADSGSDSGAAPPGGDTHNPKSGFAPPSVAEVRAFCAERGNTLDPEAFVAHYESKGWIVGKNRMRNWQAAVVTWEKNQGKFAHKSPRAGSAGRYDPLREFIAQGAEEAARDAG